MAFKDIFNFSVNASSIGTNAGDVLSGYIPNEPNEDVSVQPHDPWQDVQPSQQDPKLVRETSPQAQGIFTMIGALTTAVENSSNAISAASDEPGTVNTPSASIMGDGQNTSHKSINDVPSPTHPPVEKPTVSWPDKPNVTTPTKPAS